ncbi:MAG: MetQ/NlpA family ABC transporter substrate-binding protein [Oscillospiraceae bacterium]
MKKITALVLALILSLSLLTSCAQKAENPPADDESKPQAEAVTLKIGASPTPHAEILKFVKETLAEQGVNLEVIEFTDYVQPNIAVENGDIDANYFQHKPYLDDFNTENKTHLVSIAAIHYEPFGIYAGKTKSLDELADGAKIAVPNDVTNEARALLLLESQGIIKLKADIGLKATKLDIVENPKNVEIIEIEAAQIARSLPDVDFAAINVNYAQLAGLSVAKDALIVEDKNSTAADTYANIIVVKEGNENNEAVKKLCDALKSEEVRKYIETTFNGEVIPKF